MNDSVGGDPVPPSGNFSFVIGASLRAASIRTGRKQIRVPTLSDMKGRRMVALGNDATAWFTKVRLPSVVPAEVWSPVPRFPLAPSSLSHSSFCRARHFRHARFFFGIFEHGRARQSRSFFDGDNSGRRPRMRLIDGRELARSSESRGYLSIDRRPHGASAAFRVIRGRWEQIRVLAFPRFRARLATTVQTAEVRYARWGKGEEEEKGDSFSLM